MTRYDFLEARAGFPQAGSGGGGGAGNMCKKWDLIGEINQRIYFGLCEHV